MKKGTGNYVRLGLFITIGTAALIVALYLIGSKRNIFGSTISIHSQFYNVNGLVAGNNVRYAGIDIGTVDRIRLENDSSVSVYMVIEKRHSQFIRKNSVASVGTDGLMGNKIVNINPGQGFAGPIEDGDLILSLKPVENDEMIRTLNTTNENLAAITGDLRRFTSRLNMDKGLLRLLEDSVSTNNVRRALSDIRNAAEDASDVMASLNQIAAGLTQGKGVAGVLLRDSVKANQLRTTITNLKIMSDSLNQVLAELNEFSTGLNNPDGLLHTVTSDTALARNVKEGLKNLEEGTVLLNENLKAMRRNFLFRKYFKEQDKKNK